MSGFTFAVDLEGIKEIAAGAEMLAFVDAHAERVLAAALQLAPVESGEYRDSLSVTKAHAEDGTVVAELGSSSWRWHFVEFGTIHNRAYHVLERAVTEAGLQFQPDGR